eukprot:352324-Chlamydomonas_euryale.AAC.2
MPHAAWHMPHAAWPLACHMASEWPRQSSCVADPSRIFAAAADTAQQPTPAQRSPQGGAAARGGTRMLVAGASYCHAHSAHAAWCIAQHAHAPSSHAARVHARPVPPPPCRQQPPARRLAIPASTRHNRTGGVRPPRRTATAAPAFDGHAALPQPAAA